MRRLHVIVGLGCLVALVFACFGRALLRDGQFGYRDAAHFYYPLYLRVQQEWQAGRLPLWEPEENAGMPLLGNPTAAVLYPGKLVFAVLPYAWGMRLYVVGHVVLAVAATYVLLRSWGVSRAGAGLASLGYGFGAPVLFQYCNVVFLVGAAWTPLGLRSADRWLRLGRRGAIAELAVILALQTLGGDPQAAYEVGLCAGGYAVALAWCKGKERSRRREFGWGWWLVGLAVLAGWTLATLWLAAVIPTLRPDVAPGKPPAALPWSDWANLVVLAVWGLVGLILLVCWRRSRANGATLWPRLMGLLGAGLLGLALTGAQLVPVLEYSSLSLRAAKEGTHDIYPFSLHPYRLAELAWPRLFGSPLGINRAWMPALGYVGQNERIWVPTVYLGGLTLALAAGAFGFRGGPPWRAWLSVIAVLSLLASLGEYASPLWWARWSPTVAARVGPHDPPESTPIRADGWLRDGDGSPYWLMAATLPGFGSFRYPAKLLTFTALGLCGLAGLGWDRLAAGRWRRTSAIAAGVLVLSLPGLAWTVAEPERSAGLLGESAAGRARSIFGPFDAPEAVRWIALALGQGAAVMAVALALARLARRHPKSAGVAALVAMAADLAIANAGLVVTVPQRLFEETPRVAELIEQAERESPSPGPFRIHRMGAWHPLVWTQEGSPDRIADFVRWERGTLQPKYAIPLGLDYTIAEGTTELYDYWWFFSPFTRRASERAAAWLGVPEGRPVVVYPRRGFDLWNTRYFVLPANAHGWQDVHRGFASFVPDTEPIFPRSGIDPETTGEDWERFRDEQDFQILRNRAAYPRAWIVHNVLRKETIRGLKKEDREGPMETLLYQDDPLWSEPGRFILNLKAVAMVEVDSPSEIQPFPSQTGPDPAERVEFLRNDPRRVELEVTLNRPGLVVLADVYYPGWRLTIDDEPATILRTNRMMRGAAVPSGKHRLVYSYDPASFKIGAGLSGLGLVALAAMVLRARRRPVASWCVPGKETP